MNHITIDDLSFSYAGSDRLILDHISANVESGEFVCILGQSGCGKSTFLRLLSGLEKPSKGSIKIDDESVTKASLDKGVVFQDYGLFPWMTAGDNIMLALEQKFKDKSKTELKDIAINMIKRVGLEESVFRKLPKELSGGMKQRCAIAQSFAIDPPILLMDEPFGALDAVTRVRLQDLVLELWRQGNPRKTVFFVTHDVDEAMILANRILILGQSPSKVIYDIKIDDSKRPTRETQFEDPECLKLRNTLIKQINQDIQGRVD